MSDYDIIFEEIYGTSFETFEKHFIMSMITAFLRNQEYDDWGTSWRSAQIDTAEYYRKNNFDLGDDYDKTVNSSITRGMTGIGQNGPFNNRNGMLDKISQFFRGEEDGISVPIISNLGESQTKKIIEKIRSFTKSEFPFKQKPAQSTGTEEINTIIDLLRLRKNVILEGVPGTGKTWIRDKVRKGLNDAEMEVVTFHPASTYEEFVGGIFPTSSNDGSGTLLFEYQDGTLSRFANTAMGDEEREYILFIDEINRANIPLVMGELLTIIEPTKRTTPVVGTKALSDGSRDVDGEPWEVAVHVEKEEKNSKYLRLPSNLYFLATMNTSDRSVVSMDAALRRRFAYYRIETKLTENGREEMWAALKKYWWGDKQDTFDTVFSVLAKINQHLKSNIGPDTMLGHSYLFFSGDEVVDLNVNQVVSEMMELNILPQIADTLTSMNKTDQTSVDSINNLLREMPNSMLRHELKAPTSGGKSLDIAVTVCRREVGLVIKDDNGVYFFSERNEKINSQFSIVECNEDDVHLVLHAQGGGDNPQYIGGFETLLEICSHNEFPIIEIRNDSRTWKKNADSDSDLIMEFNYPIFAWEHEPRELRLEIGRKTGSGSPFKRIKFIFTNIWGEDVEEIERIFTGIQD